MLCHASTLQFSKGFVHLMLWLTHHKLYLLVSLTVKVKTIVFTFMVWRNFSKLKKPYVEHEWTNKPVWITRTALMSLLHNWLLLGERFKWYMYSSTVAVFIFNVWYSLFLCTQLDLGHVPQDHSSHDFRKKL